MNMIRQNLVKQPGVTIAICTHNGEGRLPETLRYVVAVCSSDSKIDAVGDGDCRIAATGLFPYEVLIIDNASTDQTCNVAKETLKDSSVPFRIIHEPKLGLMHARHTAFREAKYSIISFIDDDNWIAPDWVNIAWEVMERNPTIGVCGSLNTAVCEGDPPVWFDEFKEHYAIGHQGEPGDITESRGYVFGAGMTVRVEAWQKILRKGFTSFLVGRKGAELSAGEDSEMCFALRQDGWRIWYEPTLTLQHFIPANRLNWKYMRGLFKGFGGQSLGNDIYDCVRESKTQRTWKRQSLVTAMNTVCRIMCFWKNHEGKREDLWRAFEQGRLASFLQKRREYDHAITRVARFPWRTLQEKKEKHMYILSVITPVKNAAHCIERCIENVIAQKCPHAEHIIVDGGSTDGTVKIIEKYASTYPHIRWISEVDHGQSDALNTGIAMAQGEILASLNADDDYEPNTLNTVCMHFKNLPKPSLLVGNCNVWDEEGNLLYINKPSRLRLRDILIGRHDIIPYPVNPSAYFYHASLHDRIGLFNTQESHAMDLDFLLRAIKHANVMYRDEVWGNFRIMPGTRTYHDAQNNLFEERKAPVMTRYRKTFLPLEQMWLFVAQLFLRIKHEV
jgi:glycosyltransferase involved in cell wall biosynthesis